ncbi:PstS family phosphate ABC transporter substrate-binding protein [Bacillus sp. FJAT-45350]|uniref:PstS family phosphate ABC transporter substrate-binding protein n=1 Tax=Bacillus sp. FJAT-45350 TaxID=2011014 RepID=UPI000BB7D4EE|nr:PstS family phosphate ABC transporter substrate-binding protein [Bacillus sp. FJAT-45350]
MKFFKRTAMALGLTSLMMVAAACGGGQTNGGTTTEDNDTNDTTQEEAPVTDEELSGSVVIDGSGTVFPFMSQMAENYMVNKEQNVSVEVSRAGTSAGFGRFLVKNGTDFNNASRHIRDTEIEEAEALGFEVQELKVALDGLTFVINKENDWATELTKQELVDIFLGSSDVKNWSDIRPEFPNEPIAAMGPNENHGTYEFFWEVILEKEDLKDNVNLQQEYSTLVNLVAEDKNGIAFFGYGYYVNNTDRLAAVNVDFGNGPVEPSLDTIAEDGEYGPFTRPVFTYLNLNMAQEKPQVLDFAVYAVENAQQVASETGFAPLSDADIQEYLETLNALK